MLKETRYPLLLGGAGKQMVKVRAQYLLIPDSEGRWRVQEAGEPAHSILDLGFGAISLSEFPTISRRYWSHEHLLGLQPNTSVCATHRNL